MLAKLFHWRVFFISFENSIEFKIKLGNLQDDNELLLGQPLSVRPHDDCLVPNTESCQDSQTDKNWVWPGHFYFEIKLGIWHTSACRQFYRLISNRELSEKNQYNLPPIFCKIGVFYTGKLKVVWWSPSNPKSCQSSAWCPAWWPSPPSPVTGFSLSSVPSGPELLREKPGKTQTEISSICQTDAPTTFLEVH